MGRYDGTIMVFQEDIRIETKGHRDIHNITDAVADIVRRSAVQTGTVHVFNIGSTGCIGAIEFEPGLSRDIADLLDRLIPPSDGYGHEQAWHDGNGHSHVQSALLGPSIAIPVRNGGVKLGTWQQVIAINHDNRPRKRTIELTVIGTI